MSQEKANLARIRDNQRRSRARRKDYLAELEGKLRQCELQGAEASSEIQLAARRVAEENKRLRSLLVQYGVSNDSVDVLLRNEASNNGPSDLCAPPASGAVQALEQMLITKRQCCVDGNKIASRSSPSTSSRNERNTTSREASVNTMQSGWEPQRAQNTKTTLAPGSSISTNSVEYSQYSSQAQQRTQVSSQATNQNLISNHQLSYSPPSTNMVEFDPQYMSASNSPYSQLPYSYTNKCTPTSSGVNSCLYAADMITTMAGGDPLAVREDLGCIQGMDCDVDSQLVFSVMDKYHGGL